MKVLVRIKTREELYRDFGADWAKHLSIEDNEELSFMLGKDFLIDNYDESRSTFVSYNQRLGHYNLIPKQMIEEFITPAVPEKTFTAEEVKLLMEECIRLGWHRALDRLPSFEEGIIESVLKSRGYE